MRQVNGRSILRIARKFNAEIAASSGHVLLIGATGTGKTTILENLLKAYPAAYHDFQTRLPEPGELEAGRVFASSPVAVVDYIDLDSATARPLIDLLRTCRKDGCRLIVSTMHMPNMEALGQFSKVFELIREAPGKGVKMIVPGRLQ